MTNDQTAGEVIIGKHARFYDMRKTLWTSIRHKHTSLIELKPGDRLLDVGCGTGTNLTILSDKYGSSVDLNGVEPSSDMLIQAKQKLGSKKSVRLQQAYAEKLPFADATFDYVTCSLVMHHLPLKSKQETLREIYRVMKPGAKLVLTDWEKPSNALGKLIAFLWRNHAYVAENTQGVFVSLLENVNFTDIDTKSIQFGIVHHIIAKK